MEQEFEPRNDLEQKLLDAQSGRLPGDQFMQELLVSQVFLPVYDKHGIGGFQDSDKAQPLSLATEEGFEVLPIFTSPERAAPFLRDFPGYEGGLLCEFKWILERMGVGEFGISLNPGSDVGIDMEPDMVAQLRQDAE
jgi:hypothetical protein